MVPRPPGGSPPHAPKARIAAPRLCETLTAHWSAQAPARLRTPLPRLTSQFCLRLPARRPSLGPGRGTHHAAAAHLLLDLQLQLRDAPPGPFDLLFQRAGGVPAVHLTDALGTARTGRGRHEVVSGEHDSPGGVSGP